MIFRWKQREENNSITRNLSRSDILILLGDSWNYMPPILVPSSAKRITTQMLVIQKLDPTKDFVLRGFVCDIIRPSKELPVQRYLLKHKNKMWKLFEQANVCQVHIEKIGTFDDKIGYIICYVVVYWNLWTNSIWTYTFTTLRVN